MDNSGKNSEIFWEARLWILPSAWTAQVSQLKGHLIYKASLKAFGAYEVPWFLHVILPSWLQSSNWCSTAMTKHPNSKKCDMLIHTTCMLNHVWLFATPQTSPPRLLCLWDSPDKNTGVGCHFLLQGAFLTQASNLPLLCLLHFRQILYHWATRKIHTRIAVFQ